MYSLVYTNKFKKDVKRLQKRGLNMGVLRNAIIELEQSGTLQKQFRPHKLLGNYVGYSEAHLMNDWLIIWKIIETTNEIWLTRTGTHSDLF